MKRHLALTAAGVAAATLALAPMSAEAKDLVLGLSFGKTGRFASIGRTTEVSVDIAVREINAAGGINGMKLRVVKFDTGGDPKQAVVAVRKFARDDKALAVIGPLASAEARVAFPAGERLGIVQMTNASSAPKLADRFPYAYRIGESEALQFIRVVKTLKKKGMLKKNEEEGHAQKEHCHPLRYRRLHFEGRWPENHGADLQEIRRQDGIRADRVFHGSI